MSSSNLMRLRAAKDYLKSKFVTVSDQWIANQLTPNNHISNEMVYQSWLNSDLRAISSGTDSGVLPKDCNQIKLDQRNERHIKTTLYDRYAVQINSIQDISRPKILSAADTLDDTDPKSGSEEEESNNEGENRTKLQFKKRKTETNKKEVTKRGPRMLSLILTDGNTQIKAVEYQPIPQLSVDTPIGTKLLITGPLEIYSAVIFLTASNLKILGGSLPLAAGSSGGTDPTPPLRTIFPQRETIS